MKIWFECIKLLRRKQNNQLSLFATLDADKYQYTYSDLYLGAQAIIRIPVQHIEILFQYSVKDGIIVKLKSCDPYQVLFSFIDGAYYINDLPKEKYDVLIEKLLGLRREQETCKQVTYEQAFERLERIMYSYFIEYYYEP